ncbi:MAG: universal stress protein [Gammaproteobacteria bacterium]|nr:universal stress protein [Gammaproteobacteria bacterium]
MNRFKKILCYVEPVYQADAALLQAIEIARSNSAQLSLVCVVSEIPISTPNLQQDFIDIRRAELQALLKSMDTTGVVIDIKMLTGNLGALHVIHTAIDGGYDLVVKPTDNTSRSENALFGSNDQHLLRKCPVPVWLIKPQKKYKPERILAAIDVNPDEEENTELNRLIIQLATSLAQHYDSELHIVHAWKMYGEDMLRGGRTLLPQSEVDQMVERLRLKHKEWLDSFLNQLELENIPVKVHFQQGEVAEVISRVVTEESIDLTVMGTVARTGIPGFFIGNTAEKILLSINSSVLAVKPAGFRSPVY